MKMRLLDLEYPENPYLSLATDEAIFHGIRTGKAKPTFRFYRHANAVILGCFQLADEEIDGEFASKNNIIIAKRLTGGGAVYHDLGDLNYSVIMKDSLGIGMNVTKLFSTMIKGAVTSFKSAGVNAEAGKLNDVTANGKKILGSAATIREDTLLFHAATLVDTNLTTLASVLKVPGIKLKDKGVNTILEHVTNIKQINGKGVEEMKKALLEGYAQEMGFEYEEGELTAEEEQLAKHLYENKYSKQKWNKTREIINIL